MAALKSDNDQYTPERSSHFVMLTGREKISLSDGHRANPTQLQTLKPTLFFALFSTLKHQRPDDKG